MESPEYIGTSDGPCDGCNICYACAPCAATPTPDFELALVSLLTLVSNC